MPSPTPKFYKRSPTRPGTNPLNAIAPQAPDPAQAAQRAENLAACLELRDLGMALARAAAARALAAQDQPASQEPAAKPADPDLAFARHARSVRQSVELWEKITNNAFARRPQSAEPAGPNPRAQTRTHAWKTCWPPSRSPCSPRVTPVTSTKP